jgi:hypothetical protein
MKLLKFTNSPPGLQTLILRFRINQDNLSKCKIWFRLQTLNFLSHLRKNLTLEKSLGIQNVFVTISYLLESPTKLCSFTTTKSLRRMNQCPEKHPKNFKGKRLKKRISKTFFNLTSPLVWTSALHSNVSFNKIWKNKRPTLIKFLKT